MKDYFKDPQTNQLFRFWITQFPESFHQLDMNRFYDFLLNLFSTDEELTSTILKRAVQEEKKWIDNETDEFVETFMNKYTDLKSFWEHTMKG